MMELFAKYAAQFGSLVFFFLIVGMFSFGLVMGVDKNKIADHDSDDFLRPHDDNHSGDW